MANRVYIIPRRNDLDGIGVQLTDLSPNTSQKNGVLSGEGQTHYVGSCPDAPGATVVSGTAFVSGSRSTTLLTNPVEGDTTGNGADNFAPATTTFGLAAYIRERVQKATNGHFLTVANANNIAAAIRTSVESSSALTAPAISALCNAEDLGSSLTADPSFGTVDDILRILSGEVYVSPRYTLITDDTQTFINKAARDVLVAAQISGVTNKVFVSTGHFLTSLDKGFVGRPTLANTGYLLASVGVGQIYTFTATALPNLNPAFTYGAAGTALDMAGGHIPATGKQKFFAVYTNTGVKLA